MIINVIHQSSPVYGKPYNRRKQEKSWEFAFEKIIVLHRYFVQQILKHTSKLKTND